jgi:hypothetical protein
LSDVVGAVVTTDAVQDAPPATAMFAGQEIVGRIGSVTVTVKAHVAILPAASLTVYVTVVTPLLNVYVPTLLIPVAAEVAIVAPVIAHVNLFTPQLSAVVGLGVTTDALQVAPVVVIIFAGQEIVGTAVSVIVTVNEQVALLFAASRTV